MSFKVVRKNEAVTYFPKNHYDMRATRLHNPADVNQGSITMGLSHFLPGGGCNYGSNAKESIYYIVKGEMTLSVEKGTPDEVHTVLHEGDSFHCGPGTMKEIKNEGSETAEMLVVIVAPAQAQ